MWFLIIDTIYLVWTSKYLYRNSALVVLITKQLFTYFQLEIFHNSDNSVSKSDLAPNQHGTVYDVNQFEIQFKIQYYCMYKRECSALTHT